MDSFEELEGDMQRLAALAPYDAFFNSKFVDLALRIRTNILLDGVALPIPDKTVERMMDFAAGICWSLPGDEKIPDFDADLMFEMRDGRMNRIIKTNRNTMAETATQEVENNPCINKEE